MASTGLAQCGRSLKCSAACELSVGARGRPLNLCQSCNNASKICDVQVVYPGAYRCVCVQIKLHHMAVNATAQAGVIGELEGAALLDSSLDPQGAGPAFKVLKQLVSNWLHDAVQNHNRCVRPVSRDVTNLMGSKARAHSVPLPMQLRGCFAAELLAVAV